MKFANLLKRTAQNYFENKIPMLAAALSYYTLFSMGPVLIIVTWIAGFFFKDSQIQTEILSTLAGVIGSRGAAIIKSIIDLESVDSGSTLVAMISIAVLIYGSSMVVYQLHNSLNIIWEIDPKKRIRDAVRRRAIAFSLVIAFGFFLVVSFSFQAILANLTEQIPANEQAIAVIYSLAAFCFMTLLFAATYKSLPDHRMEWKHLWLGSSLTALIFFLGQLLIGQYLANTDTTGAYGPVGSILIILFWIYYSSQIILIGAQFTKEYTR